MRGAVAALAAVFFAAYLATASGTLPPYRDAGELVSSASTLGVSHPPGYPLYLLTARAALAVPLGSEAYRLNVLSAAAGAGAVAALAWAAWPLAGAWSLFGAALFGLDRVFWQVSTVPEPYSLGLFLAALSLGLAIRLRLDWSARRLYLLALLFGLALGARLDLLLLAPALLLLPFRTPEEALLKRGGDVAAAFLFFLAGFAVYLYLPLRASARPWLDWADPSTFPRFLGALTRQSYGGTLDLLSREYAAGSNFDANLLAWGRRLLFSFGPALAFCAAGLGAFGAWGPGPLLGTLAAGPLFLFLANMPPNPHALAIVEPHYLTAGLLLAAAAAVGAKAVSRPSGRSRWLIPASATLLAVLALQRSDSNRRWELIALDSADSQLRPVPPGGRLVAKKDVQLFSLWHAREVLGRRKDAVVVAEGLSGSDWYRAGLAREFPSLAMPRLGQSENWRPFLSANGPAFATMDADWPPELSSSPRGLAVLVSTAEAPPDARPWLELACLRGSLSYDEQADFFSSDLVSDYSAAWHRAGEAAQRAGDAEEAYRRFALAWAAKPLSPEAPLYMGLIRFKQGRAEDARRLLSLASSGYDETLDLGRRYRALPGVLGPIRKQSAMALLDWGAADEKLGMRDEAAALYERASVRDPLLAQAHFNLAVVYWGRDWGRSRAELLEALRLDPGNAQAAGYLARIPR